MNNHTLFKLAQAISGAGWTMLTESDKAIYKALSDNDRYMLDNLLTSLYTEKTINKLEQ